MKVQLSEKSKAEFIELIAKDSITCWFEGDEFVMPSGQGKTAKGIVLGKLLVWQHRQTKVDELTLQVAEMKSRLNDAYTDGQSAMYTARQSKVDELQRRNQMLNDNIKEQGQKLVYQNEVIETQAEKLLGLRNEKAELQKRVDAALKLIPSLKAENDLWGCDQVDRQIELLEQALKGGGE